MYATGGTGALTYSWNTGATSNCISGLTAGTYSVKVTDTNGCNATWTITLVNPTQVVATTTSVNITCNNANNGTAQVSVTGGTAPYTYTWSNGASTASITGLAAGTYTVVVKDSKGCAANGSVTIVNPPAITTTKTMGAPNCYNGNDGWACVTATGWNRNTFLFLEYRCYYKLYLWLNCWYIFCKSN